MKTEQGGRLSQVARRLRWWLGRGTFRFEVRRVVGTQGPVSRPRQEPGSTRRGGPWEGVGRFFLWTGAAWVCFKQANP